MSNQKAISSEALVGILLFSAVILALLFQNVGALSGFYNSFIEFTPFSIENLHIKGSVAFWVNDLLMVVFFFMIGLELKREIFKGELRDPSKIAVPVLAALGGVIMPALIFASLNFGDEFAIRGWAIPVATDIAFVLAILALLGDKIPQSLKLFVLTATIMDDVFAILIIAFFYTDNLSFLYLALSGVITAILFAINRLGINKKAPFILLGILLWLFILNSGVHATIAGIILAFTIPAKGENSMLESIEHAIHSPVNFIILPIFAFVNAGISLQRMEISSLFSSVPLGIIFGLFLGKQIGIFGFSFVAIRLGLGNLPKKTSWTKLYATATICGIGFTMSLFIDNLSYGGSDAFDQANRLAILIGSLISGIIGYLVAKFSK